MGILHKLIRSKLFFISQRISITALLLVSISNSSFSQNITLQGLDLSQDIGIWYDSIAGLQNTSLILGTLPNTERKAPKSHPFLNDYRWNLGDVIYRGELYRNVSLLYNIELDILLTQRSSLSKYDQFVELKRDMVSSFRLYDAHYRWVNSKIQYHKPGFYEILFEGDQLNLLAKRSKALDEREMYIKYIQKDQYYINKGDVFFIIKSSSELARNFKEHRKSIKDFARQNNIRKLNINTDKEFVKLIKFCDSLELK